MLRVSARTEFDHHFWRAATWFVVLCMLALGAMIALVVSDLVNSSSLERLADLAISLVPTALAMLTLSALRSGAATRLQTAMLLKILVHPLWDWLLLPTCLTATFLVSQST